MNELDPSGLLTTAAADKSKNAVVCCKGTFAVQIKNNLDPGTPDSVKQCIREHEESHIEDFNKEDKDICKGKQDGERVGFDGPDSKKKLRDSERKAYGRELGCILKALNGPVTADERKHLEKAKGDAQFGIIGNT